MKNTTPFALIVIVMVGITAGCGKQDATPTQAPPQSSPPAASQAAPAVAAPAPATPAPVTTAPAAEASPAPAQPSAATNAVAAALSPADLARKSGCLACHAVDKKLVGPAYQEIAKKYSAADAAKLVAKVKTGGAGVWGTIAMPPHSHVAEADIKIIVKWILEGAR